MYPRAIHTVLIHEHPKADDSIADRVAEVQTPLRGKRHVENVLRMKDHGDSLSAKLDVWLIVWAEAEAVHAQQ